MIEDQSNTTLEKSSGQFTTFYIDDRCYGIDVMRIQEITRPMPRTPVPLSPNYVLGLINLRGQISTAICLRRFFGIQRPGPENEMNVVCRIDGMLFSFLVDRIGDVIELDPSYKASVPSTIEENLRRYIDGIYKLPKELLTILNIEKISENINVSAQKDR